MKKIFLPFVICVGTLSILARLFYLQVLEKESRKDSIASDVAIEVSYDYPERGYIYDRNGKLLVTNQSAYDIMVIPREVKPLDTLEFCNLVGIDIVRFREELDKAKKYSYRKPSVFVQGRICSSTREAKKVQWFFCTKTLAQAL